MEGGEPQGPMGDTIGATTAATTQDREYKQEFYRGPCKIERRWERNGEYKEETKCKGYR